MSSSRLTGWLDLVTVKPSRLGRDRVTIETEPVVTLLSADFRYASVERRNRDIVRKNALPTTLEAWSRLSGVSLVPLARDGSVSVSQPSDAATDFIISKAEDGGDSWRFRAESAEAALAWTNALARRIQPWNELFAQVARKRSDAERRFGNRTEPRDSPARIKWKEVDETSIARLRALPEVQAIEAAPSDADAAGSSTAGALVELLGGLDIGPAADFAGSLEPFLAFMPVVSAALSVIGMGVSLLARVANVRLNRQKTRDARLNVEEISRDVLYELWRIVNSGGGRYRRFKVLSEILEGLEDVVRSLDKYELSHGVNRYAQANAPEEILGTLETLRRSSNELADAVDVDVMFKEVVTLREQNKRILAVMDEIVPKFDLIQDVTQDHTRNVNAALIEALTADGVLTNLVPALVERLVAHGGVSASSDFIVMQRSPMEEETWASVSSTVPPIDEHVISDFSPESQTVEAQLKRALLEEDDRNRASGGEQQQSQAIGLWGGAGTGKTAALLLAANDEDVRDRFVKKGDGIFFMRLSHLFAPDGREFVLALAKVIGSAVGDSAADEISGMGLDDGVERMRRWFQGRRALLVVDNIWGYVAPGSSTMREEWLWRVRLIAGGTNTVIFSTRDHTVMSIQGCRKIDVMASEAQSPRSLKIFKSWLSLKEDGDERFDEKSARKVLQYCGGLPLSLAIAAASVRSSFYMWDLVVEEFSQGGLLEEQRPGVHSSAEERFLHSSVAVSLKVMKRASPEDVDRFKALAVFRRRSRIPVQNLAILWSCSTNEALRTCLRFHGLALASISERRTSGYSRLELHDSVVQFIRYYAAGGAVTPENEQLIALHRSFLRSFARAKGLVSPARRVADMHPGDSLDAIGLEGSGVSFRIASNGRGGRSEGVDDLPQCPWWEMEDDFMLDVVVRHLMYAGWRHRAEELLCDARWLRHRLLRSGVAKGIRDDYTALLRPMDLPSPGSSGQIGGGAFEDSSPISSPRDKSHSESAMRAKSFTLIRRALISASPNLRVDYTQLGFQLLGRLHVLVTKSNEKGRRETLPADALLKSVREAERERPSSLVPLWQCFMPPQDPLQLILDTSHSGLSHSAVRAVATSPASHLIALAVQNGIAIFDWDSARVVDAWRMDSDETHAQDVAWMDSSTVVVASSDCCSYVYKCHVKERAGETRPSDAVLRGKLARSPIGKLVGHSEPLTRVTVSLPGERLHCTDREKTYIATASRDHCAKVFTVEGGPRSPVEIASLEGHTGAILDICFIYPRGQVCILTASADSTINLYSLEGRKLCSFVGHGGPVNALAVYGYERFLSGSDDKTIRYWCCPRRDGDEGHLVETLRGHENAVTSLTASKDGIVVSASKVGLVLRVWELQTGGNSRLGRAHEDLITWLCGCWRENEGFRVLSSSWDGTCRIWDVSRQRRHSRSGLVTHTSNYPIHAVTNVPIDDVKSVLVSCSSAGNVCVFDSASGKSLCSATLDGDDVGATVDADALTSSPGSAACSFVSGKYGGLVTGGVDGTCRVWDIVDNRSGTRLVQRSISVQHSAPVVSVLGLANGRVASGADDGSLFLWCPERGHLPASNGQALSGAAVTCLASNVDGNILVVGRDDGSLSMLSGDNAHEVICPPLSVTEQKTGAVLDVCIVETRHHPMLVVGIYKDRRIRVWGALNPKDFKQGFRVSQVLRGHTECETACLVAIPNTNWVVSGSSDNSLRLWEITLGGEEGASDAMRRRSSPSQDTFYHNPISANARLGESIILADMIADVLSLTMLPSSFGNGGRGGPVVGVGLSSGVLTKVEISPPSS